MVFRLDMTMTMYTSMLCIHIHVYTCIRQQGRQRPTPKTLQKHKKKQVQKGIASTNNTGNDSGDGGYSMSAMHTARASTVQVSKEGNGQPQTMQNDEKGYESRSSQSVIPSCDARATTGPASSTQPDASPVGWLAELVWILLLARS